MQKFLLSALVFVAAFMMVSFVTSAGAQTYDANGNLITNGTSTGTGTTTTPGLPNTGGGGAAME